jgi:hypothetical protein
MRPRGCPVSILTTSQFHVNPQIVQPGDLIWNARQLEAGMPTYGIELHEMFVFVLRLLPMNKGFKH